MKSSRLFAGTRKIIYFRSSLISLGRSIVLLVVTILLGISANAQYSETNPAFKPQPSPQGPTSASLSKFGDYQVSLFTGVPDISIPLYEIKSGNLTVPIVLRYHASGIKVTDASSWVGLGWAVDVGGQISRRIMGAKEDENPVDGYLTTIFPIANELDVSNAEDQTYLNNHYINYYDTEPDIYSYDFPGESGKFFLNRHNSFQPEPISFTPIKIVRNGNNQSFDITDVNGNVHKYGTREITTSGYSSSQRTACSAWKLDKITSVDPANFIDFAYTIQNTTTVVQDVQDTWVVEELIECGHTNGDPCVYESNSGGSNHATPVETTTTEQVLQEITFRTGKIVFERSPSLRQDLSQSKSLSQIKIYAYDFSSPSAPPILVKTISFVQSYFAPGTTSSRLKLDEVHFRDNASNTVSKYSFNYNWRTLPTTTSRARDYWGYYNGIETGSLVPGQNITTMEWSGEGESSTGNYFIGGAQDGRDPRPLYNQACMLERIDYPTGGYSTFTFETNSYKEGSVTRLTGGLRIQSIKSYDGIHSTPVIKTYEYGPGRANFNLNRFYFMALQHYLYYTPTGGSIASGLNSAKRVRTYLSSPSIDLVPSDHAIVVYPTVTEYVGDATTNSGKTVYTFTDYLDMPGTSIQSKPTVISNYYKRGLPLTKKVYKSDGTPVYEEVNEYFAFAPKVVDNVGFVMNCEYVFEGQRPEALTQTYRSAYSMNNYQIIGGDNYLKKKTVIEYDQQNPSLTRTSITDFSYENIKHQQVTKSVTINSKGERVTTVSKFPLDYTLTTGVSNTRSQAVRNLQQKGLINSLIEHYVKIDNTDGTNSRTVSGTLLDYHLASPHIKTAYQLDMKTPATNFSPATVADANSTIDSRYKPVMFFNQYDSYGNICEQQKPDDVKEVFVWGYRSSYPVARVLGSDYSEVSGAVNSTVLNEPLNDAALNSQFTNLRTALVNRKTLISTFTYKPLVGMTSETDPRQRTTFYEYDAFGRLAYVRDHENNIVKQICYSYNGQITDCSQNTAPLWQQTGQTRCKPCAANANYTVGITQNQEQDNNPYSFSHGDTKWVDGAANPSCASAKDWQNTAAPLTCEKNFLNDNTGQQLQEQKDMNPCTALPGETRQIVAGTNTTTCPLNTNPVWEEQTSITRCKPCAANSNYTLAIRQVQEKDINPNSLNPGQTRWKDMTGGSWSCVASSADWQFTSTPIRCKKAPGTQSNTGEQEREQLDMNPCTAIPNNPRWVVVGTNTTTCPLPPVGVSYSNSSGNPATVTLYGTAGTIGTHSFNIPASGNAFLGTIPVGTYNIVVSGAGTATYQVNSLPSQTGTSLTLYDVPLFNTSCHITIY